MKKCRRCTKPATLHITEIRNGEAQALHLCEGCAKDYLKTVSVGSPNEEAPAFEAGGNPDAAGSEAEPDERDTLTCPKCGITFKQFRSQGRLGCPHDYVAFREELLPLIESIHSEVQHVGKVPQRVPGISRRQYDLLKLRADLKSAVQNEKYEEAARLRDQIQQLEAEAPHQSEAL
ncbi:MAG: UvrB/UvrC motif-containing protein [Planctomycetaceae bacterium]|nr:UvrB/UvrC motif-containing protein [Planctomycetaceae bacterium]